MEVDPQLVINKLVTKLAQKEFEVAALEAAVDQLQAKLEEVTGDKKEEGV